jgi:ABC-type transporter Mla subunit MlaD
VGYVEWREFDDSLRKTRAKIRISKKVSVFHGSTLIISSSSFLGQATLDLRDPPEDQPRIRMEEGETLEGGVEGSIDELVKQADQVLERVDTLLSDQQLGGTLKELSATVNGSLGKVDGVVAQMDAMMAENSVYLRATMKNMQAVSGNFLTLSNNLEQTSVAIRDLSTDPHNREQLDAVLANLNAASASLAATSAQAEQLSGDAELQQNIKDTLRLTKETLEETKKTVTQFQGTLGGVDTLLNNAGGLVTGASGTLDRINKITGGKSSKSSQGGSGQAAAGSGKGGSTDCADGRGLEATAGFYLRGIDYNGDGRADGHDRVVADAKAAIGLNGKYIATGVDNIGDGGEINLLLGLGSPLSGGSARAGIYRGELGAGLAWYGGGLGLEITGYSPQDPKLDAYGYIPAGDSVDIVVGVEDATGSTKVTAGAGVKF